MSQLPRPRLFATLGLGLLLAGCAQFPDPSGRGSGTLDPSFGTGGLVNVGGNDAALEPGNTVALADSVGGVLALRRLFPDGRVQEVTGHDGATAIARQADGKLVLAGQVGSAFTVARYNADLSLDTTFASGGEVITPINSSKGSKVHAVRVQPDGRIVVAGSALVLKTPQPGVALSDLDVALVRYTPTGQLDATFGTGGMTVQDFRPPSSPALTSDDSAHAVLIQPGGAIVVAGRSDDGGGDAHGLLTRFTADGTLDAAFSPTRHPAPSVFKDLAADAAGRLLVVGSTGSPGTTGLLQRYGVNGEAQASAAVSFTTTSSLDQNVLVSVAVQGDGKVLVSGATGPASTGVSTLALARFTADLVPDLRFGTSGQVVSVVPPRSSVSGFDGSLLVQPDGRIVVIGQQTARFFP